VRLQVDHANVRARARKLGNDMPADESRSSRDEDATSAQAVQAGCAHWALIATALDLALAAAER
jgi:hypothetical protein